MIHTKTMCRWIIHDWRIWLHCIVCTCGWHPLPSHYCNNYICRMPHYFCLGSLQCLSEYHFTKPWINILSRFTLYISGLVQNIMAKTSIILNKSEVIVHSGNKVNTRNRTCWKNLVWLTKINLHQCKNYQKLLWSWCLIMGLQ